MNIILRKPYITEKSMKLANDSLYTFLVGKNATKPEIKRQVAEKFQVDVLSVRTLNIKGEAKTQRRVRKYYKTTGFKKAMVQLKKGQKIATFEQSPKEEAVVTTAEGEPKVLREKKDILGRTRVKVEKSAVVSAPTTQRKVITGK